MLHNGVNWSKCVQNLYNNDQEVSHYDVLINWSKRGQLDNNGQEVYHYGVGGKQWSAIVFTVFETFLYGQTVFRHGSKRVRYTLKQFSKSGQPGVSHGSRGGQPRFTRGSARGHQGVSQGSAKGHQGVSQGSARGQAGVSQGSTRGYWYIFIRPKAWSSDDVLMRPDEYKAVFP